MTLSSSRGTEAASVAGRDVLVEEILDEFTFWMAQGRRAMTRHWSQQDLSMSNVHALALLHAHGSLPMSRLAEAMAVSLPNLTGIVGRMEERGLVERVHDERDRRVVHVRLTARGTAALEEADHARRRRLARILSDLTPEQRARCLEALRDLRAAAEHLDADGD